MKLQYFGHVTRGSAGNLALTVLEGSVDGLSPRKTQKTVDGRHRRVEWLYLHSAEGDVKRWGAVEKKDNRVVICCRQPSSTMVD